MNIELDHKTINFLLKVLKQTKSEQLDTDFSQLKELNLNDKLTDVLIALANNTWNDGFESAISCIESTLLLPKSVTFKTI